MAKLTADIDPADVLGGLMKFEKDDEIAKKMVASGAEVMAQAIREGASKHIVTGQMANSIYSTKGFITKKGNEAMAKVRFGGTSKMSKSKSGKKFDVTNWIKAFRIEYGTKNQKAHPFVRPAIRRSKNEIAKAMKDVFDREVGK